MTCNCIFANRRLQESKRKLAEGVILSGIYTDRTVIGWHTGEVRYERVPKVKAKETLRISQAKGQ